MGITSMKHNGKTAQFVDLVLRPEKKKISGYLATLDKTHLWFVTLPLGTIVILEKCDCYLEACGKTKSRISALTFMKRAREQVTLMGYNPNDLGLTMEAIHDLGVDWKALDWNDSDKDEKRGRDWASKSDAVEKAVRDWYIKNDPMVEKAIWEGARNDCWDLYLHLIDGMVEIHEVKCQHGVWTY